MPSTGLTQRKCIGCPELLGNARKKCPSCRAIQPYKAKLKATRAKFDEIKEEWVGKKTKHNNRTRILDGAHLMVDELCALGYYPLLLYGRKMQGRNTFQAHIIMPEKMSQAFSGHSAFSTMKSLYEKLLQIYTETNENTGNDAVSSVEQGPASGDQKEPMSITSAGEERHIAPDNPGISTHGRKYKLNNKRKKMNVECTMHLNADSFPYEKIMRRRVREGKREVLVRWKSCSGCGVAWKDTWEPSDEFEHEW